MFKTKCVTVNADLEPKTHHQTPMTCIWTKVFAPPSLEQKKALPKLWLQRWKHNSRI